MEAPEIVYWYPENEKTNFADNLIEFEFSEYMNRQSVLNSIYISPTIENYEVSFSGKKLRIKINERLKDSTTYTTIISADAADLNNNNKMTRPFILIFSTGDKIYRNSISGKVYFADAAGILIYAYKRKNFDKLSDVLVSSPDYKSFSGSDGSFELKGLSEGEYVLAAIKKSSPDKSVNLNKDLVGFYSDIIKVTGENFRYDNANIFLQSIDTIPPIILRSVFVDSTTIRAVFSESIKNEASDLLIYAKIESESDKIIYPKYKYFADDKNKEIELYFESIENRDEIVIWAENVYDLNGNVAQTTSKKAEAAKHYQKKTLTALFPDDRKTFSLSDSLVKLKFSAPINFEKLPGSLSLKIDKKLYANYSIKKIDDASFYIVFRNPDEISDDIEIMINVAAIAIKKELIKDSVFAAIISAADRMALTGISGKAIFENQSKLNANLEASILVIRDSKTNEDVKQFPLKGKYEFKFENIKGGSYLFWIYEDKNLNGKYDFADIRHSILPEKFFFSSDTVKIPPRWSITEARIRF